MPSTSFQDVPWKNGRGVTRVVAVEPPGADLGSFRLRISVASVTEDGPFSAFPGVERWILALDGAGMDLTVDGRALAVEPGELTRFLGDAATVGRLRAGPLRDLNVMVRRPHAAQVQVREVEGLTSRLTTWVYVLRGRLGPAGVGDGLRLDAGDRVEGQARIVGVEGW